MEYIHRVVPDAVPPLLKALEDSNAKEIKEVVMTTWEQAIQTGKQQGQSIGLAAGLIRLCERRFGPLPDEPRARILAADFETLLQWNDNILIAATLDKVFSGPSTWVAPSPPVRGSSIMVTPDSVGCSPSREQGT
jgi:hypothetical protein